MKKLFFILAFACLQMHTSAQTSAKLNDGFYLVTEFIYDSTKTKKTDPEQQKVYFNKLFLDTAPEGAIGVIVKKDHFAPMELDEEPELSEDSDTKKKIQLSFSRVASDKLAEFTRENLSRHVTIIVNGEALTVHMIRSVISDGKIQITRCDDNACESIYVHLKNNVKH